MNFDKPVASGNTAEIYLIENKIVKVYNDNLPSSESVKEANKQKYAYACGLSVPKIFEVTNINGKQAIIMEHVKGKTLGSLFFENKELVEYYLDISVDAQLKIHSIESDNIESMSDKLRHQIEVAPILDNRQKIRLLKRLESLTFTKRLCHGDFHLFNLIQTKNQVVVIDWVDASSGDVCADVYRSYLLYSQFSRELAERYMSIYCEKSGLLSSEILKWAPIIAGARLSETVSSENSERLIEIVNTYLKE